MRRQIREMKRAGLGGHMMHARVGLITPYLGEKWMECIRAAVDESARIGLDMKPASTHTIVIWELMFRRFASPSE